MKPNIPTIAIVTEKPEVGRIIANSISTTIISEEDKNILHTTSKGANIYICSLEGNPFRLIEPQEIDPRLNSWSHPEYCVDLPFLIKSVPAKGSKQLLSRIKKYLNLADQIYFATDFDTEGEAIAHEVAGYCHVTSKAKRILLNESLDKNDVITALKSPQDLIITRQKWRAAQAKRISDWYWQYLVRVHTANARDSLLGKDLDLSKDRKRVISSGRVQSVMQSIITQHHLKRLSHQPINYYQITLESSIGTLYLKLPIPPAGDSRIKVTQSGNKIITSHDDAFRLFESLKEYNSAQVDSIQQLAEIEQPPLPFDSSTLQSEASRILKLKPSKTMQLANSLRLKGFITYVRTDEPRLPSSMLQDPDELKNKLQACSTIISNESDLNDLADNLTHPDSQYKPRCFTSDPIAHHGIIPSGKLPNEALSRLELTIFQLIAKRFVISLHPPSKTLKTQVVLSLPVSGILGEQKTCFKASSSVIKDPGFKILLPNLPNPTPLPERLQEGIHIPISSPEFVNKKTEPKSVLRVHELISQLKRPTALCSDNSILKVLSVAKGIGTAATRDKILDKLVSRGYCQIDDGKVQPTEFGIAYMKFLDPDLADVGITAKVEQEMLTIENAATDEIAVEQRDKFLQSYHSFIISHIKKSLGCRVGINHV
jgi:DNA topoisomerase IA